jgi:hypothetical protein
LPSCSPIFLKENIKDNKKDVTFLWVRGRDSYTGKFLALLAYMCVLQPTLVHLYLTSSLLPGHLPIFYSPNSIVWTLHPLFIITWKIFYTRNHKLNKDDNDPEHNHAPIHIGIIYVLKIYTHGHYEC